MKGKPSVVTPTAAIGTSNQFAALAEPEEAITEAEIPNNEYLPNLGPVEDHPTTSNSDNASSISTISTMGSSATDNGDGNEFSKAKISALMARIQTNITEVIKACTYTDIANF